MCGAETGGAGDVFPPGRGVRHRPLIRTEQRERNETEPGCIGVDPGPIPSLHPKQPPYRGNRNRAQSWATDFPPGRSSTAGASEDVLEMLTFAEVVGFNLHDIISELQEV